MQLRGVFIETLHDPQAYAPKQLDLVCKIAAMLNRGKLVLLEPPRRDA